MTQRLVADPTHVETQRVSDTAYDDAWTGFLARKRS